MALSTVFALSALITLLDIDVYPSASTGWVLKGRWIVEPDIGSVKCTIGLEHLRGQSPETWEREIWTAMFTYNFVRLKLLEAISKIP